MKSGALCVIIGGHKTMQLLSVDSLVIQRMVCLCSMYISLKNPTKNNDHVGALPYYHATFGEGSGPIHLNYVNCNGDELLLIKCDYGPADNCTHNEDAGVKCLPCKFL